MAGKTHGKRKLVRDLPTDVELIITELEKFFETTGDDDRKPCSAIGVYAFYDYDGQPIYVGQTREAIRTRTRRHLTNQRTDAVAMRVLDPLEVAMIEVWPFWELLDQRPKKKDDPDGFKRWEARAVETLNDAESTVYYKLIEESEIKAVLNEKIPPRINPIKLPKSYRWEIVPPEIRDRLGHPDVRMARRALKLAELTGIIAQRDVSVGLRKTVVTQAQRMLRLATTRFETITKSAPEASKAELTGYERDTDTEERDSVPAKVQFSATAGSSPKLE